MIALAPQQSLEPQKLDPDQIRVDAPSYQFRRNGDKCGITRSGIYSTDRWDPLLHGNPILVHERLDGSYYVADGHHRLDLAKRSNAIGQGPGKISAFVLREAEGYGVEDVRVIAAYRNMAKGRFNPVEGAGVFHEVMSGRVHKELLPELPWDNQKIRISLALSRLSDDSLSLIETGRIPIKSGLFVAGLGLPQEREYSVMHMTETMLEPAPKKAGCTSCQEKSGGFTDRVLDDRAAQTSLSR